MVEVVKKGLRPIERYLLQKRGLYYRPDNHGYTGKKSEAGRYPVSDARPHSGVTAIHEDEAPDYAPACYEDIRAADLQQRLDAAVIAIQSRDIRIAELEEAILRFLDKYEECKPYIASAFMQQYLRCGEYTGPQFGEELEALQSILKEEG